MKLKKENLKKITSPTGDLLYTYEYDGNSYCIRVEGTGGSRIVYVYKNDEYVTNKAGIFSTADSLEAWRKFEDMVAENDKSQSSSGGFKNNPQSNPKILPLLAINQSGADVDVTLFALAEDGSQHELAKFKIDKKDFVLKGDYKKEIVSTDWSNLDVIEFLKCKIAMRLYDKVVFEADREALVFLFIPESIMEQGGQDSSGGEEGSEGLMTEEQKKEARSSKSKKGKKGEKKEDGEESDDSKEKGEEEESDSKTDGGEKSEEEKEDAKKENKGGDKNDDKTGEESDDKEGDENEKGDDKNKEGDKREEESSEDGDESDKSDSDGSNDSRSSDSGSMGKPKSDIKPTELIDKLSKDFGMEQDLFLSFFRKVDKGEEFLIENDFESKREELGFPKDLTAREASEKIRNSQTQ